jgi:hypothetical protein
MSNEQAAVGINQLHAMCFLSQSSHGVLMGVFQGDYFVNTPFDKLTRQIKVVWDLMVMDS